MLERRRKGKGKRDERKSTDKTQKGILYNIYIFQQFNLDQFGKIRDQCNGRVDKCEDGEEVR